MLLSNFNYFDLDIKLNLNLEVITIRLVRYHILKISQH